MKRILCLAALLTICTACKQYVITLNETIVYEPPVLFDDYSLADQALNKCLTQTISSLNIHQVEQLTILRCTNANIERLDGLGVFTHIAVLDLADNNLKSLAELSELTHLTHLNLSNNPRLSCDTLTKLARNIDQLIQPAQCN
ncbi:MAG: leucine-rich repeat domain-containing protein [Porticoccaceae bacterium]|nr:leucine-rich repeat domain-containing protein [Porticoccaceae bacterium]